MSPIQSKYILRNLGVIDYQTALDRMRDFTTSRVSSSIDEIWLLEHPSVFTQGQAGRQEHIIKPTNIPIVQSDRGGQVTYHGPGQMVVYFLIDLKRKPFSIKDLICKLEQIIIDFLNSNEISAHRKDKAPGVYVKDAKICSLGIRVRKGCTYHGLSFNLDMDLTPFQYINPCGYEGLEITQLKNLISTKPINKNDISVDILKLINNHLDYDEPVAGIL